MRVEEGGVKSQRIARGDCPTFIVGYKLLEGTARSGKFLILILSLLNQNICTLSRNSLPVSQNCPHLVGSLLAGNFISNPLYTSH